MSNFREKVVSRIYALQAIDFNRDYFLASVFSRHSPPRYIFKIESVHFFINLLLVTIKKHRNLNGKLSENCHLGSRVNSRMRMFFSRFPVEPSQAYKWRHKGCVCPRYRFLAPNCAFDEWSRLPAKKTELFQADPVPLSGSYTFGWKWRSQT